MVAAPAVHVDKWKHWSFDEGRQNCVRMLPQGCMLTLENGHTQYREQGTGRTFEVAPYTPDEKAWREANWDKLKARGVARRQRAIGRNNPDLQNVGNQGGDRYLASTFNKNGFHLLETFWGISSLQQTPNGSFSCWPGLTTGSGTGGHFWLFQPVISHLPGGTTETPPGWTPVNSYYIADEAFDGTNFVDHQTQNYPIIEGIGYWGVIRWYAGSQWMIRCYSGNRGNLGPAYGRPKTDGLPLYDPTGFTFGPFTLAECAFELRSPEPACSDISATAVFGGVRVPGHVNWTGSWNGAGPPVCSVRGTIGNPTANPTQISISFGTS